MAMRGATARACKSSRRSGDGEDENEIELREEAVRLAHDTEVNVVVAEDIQADQRE